MAQLAVAAAAELSLRLVSASASHLRLVSRSSAYLRVLSHTVTVLSPLLPVCCATYSGFAGTFFFCSVPCCMVPVGMALLTAVLLPDFGLPADQLAPALMPPARAAAIGVPLTCVAMAVGPLGVPAAASTALHATVVLCALRIAFSTVRICLLMPSLLMSHGDLARRAGTRRDRRLADAAEGETCAMTMGGVRVGVTKLRLERRVAAVTILHPERRDKWVVSLPGNGEFLSLGIDAKLSLAASLGCSVIACDYRDMGTSPGLLLAASDMVADAAACVHYCEAQCTAAGADAASSILLLGQSMGGGVAVELAATRFPHLPCVNERSFASLSLVSAATIGLGRSAVGRALVRLALSLAFSHRPWLPPLETAEHWQRLPAGRKLLIYHPQDPVIMSAGLVYELERRGQLHDDGGTRVVRLSGRPRDSHNEDPAAFSPTEWAEAVRWMRAKLELL